MPRLLPPLLLGLFATAVLAQDRAGEDLKKLQGTWTVVAMTESGKEAPADAVKGAKFTVKDNSFRFSGENGYVGTLKLDPSKTPKALDATFIDDTGAEKGKALGIYELTGDNLKMAWRHMGNERPTTFASAKGSGIRYVVLKRSQ